jgi:predicted MFS family arabinose efflux permease
MMVLKHRDFRLLWLGQLLSKTGSQFNYIALAWLVLQTTGSALATGGVYLAQVLPAALLGWVAGVPVDRSDRRMLMFHCDWMRAVLVLVLPISFALHSLQEWLIYLVTFAISALSLLFYAAEKSVIPALVPAEELTEANAWAEITEQFGALIGPVLAGVLIAILPSPVHILYLNTATFAFSAVTLLLLSWRDHQVRATGGARQTLREAREGLTCLLQDPLLRVVFFTATAVNFLVAPFTVVFPVLSDRVLHAGATGFGWLMGAFGAGMLAGSLAAGRLARALRPANLIYGGMALLGCALAAISACNQLWPAVALAALASTGIGPSNAVILTLVQKATPERLLGRVFASLSALVQVAVPLGVALVSPLLDLLGAQTVLLGMGLGILLAAGLGRLWLGKVGEPRLEESSPAAGSGC